MSERHKPGKVTFEIPEPQPPPMPDLSVNPAVADIRERLARAETLLEQRTSDPAAGEALRLAGEAHQLATEAKNELQRVASLVDQRAEEQAEAVIHEVEPPPPPPLPDPEAEHPEPTDLGRPRAWWKHIL